MGVYAIPEHVGHTGVGEAAQHDDECTEEDDGTPTHTTTTTDT